MSILRITENHRQREGKLQAEHDAMKSKHTAVEEEKAALVDKVASLEKLVEDSDKKASQHHDRIYYLKQRVECLQERVDHFAELAKQAKQDSSRAASQSSSTSPSSSKPLPAPSTSVATKKCRLSCRAGFASPTHVRAGIKANTGTRQDEPVFDEFAFVDEMPWAELIASINNYHHEVVNDFAADFVDGMTSRPSQLRVEEAETDTETTTTILRKLSKRISFDGFNEYNSAICRVDYGQRASSDSESQGSVQETQQVTNNSSSMVFLLIAFVVISAVFQAIRGD